jgi:hypothetical protein
MSGPKSTMARAALLILGFCTLVAAIATALQNPAIRLQFDATKTRAYTLSEGTRSLLSTLDGP